MPQEVLTGISTQGSEHSMFQYMTFLIHNLFILANSPALFRAGLVLNNNLLLSAYYFLSSNVDFNLANPSKSPKVVFSTV